MKLKRDDCTLVPRGPGLYHVRPLGSEVLIATIKRFKSNSFLKQWGTRPYGNENAPWTWHQNVDEAVGCALKLPAPTADA